MWSFIADFDDATTLKLKIVLYECFQLYTYGFTDDKARRYFTNKEFTFEKVLPFTGTCLLLMKTVQKSPSLGVAQQAVTKEVELHD